MPVAKGIVECVGGPEPVLRFIRNLAIAEESVRSADRALLERFLGQQGENAFASLVRRHGPMVFGVCLQVLHDEQDAEDAFQATFLILCVKAATVQKQESLGSWPYGVANHTAANLRRNSFVGIDAYVHAAMKRSDVHVLPISVVKDGVSDPESNRKLSHLALSRHYS